MTKQKKISPVEYNLLVLAGIALLVLAVRVVDLSYENTEIVFAVKRYPVMAEELAPTPTPTPSEKVQIVAYITKLWEKHGTAEVVRAINCFYSESGLRSEAYGVNRNGSNDAGVAQVNSIHGMSVEDRMDYKKNLDKAYQIYLNRGWDAWYGSRCR